MKTKRQSWKRGRQWLLAIGVLAACGSGFTSCKDDYDLDERLPENWGSSIYNWLVEKGNYKNTVRLIDELDYRDVLAVTGSKTMFVADDAAYERFFKNNNWGVKGYGDLSETQKRLLLFGSMLDNSMQLASLSNVQAADNATDKTPLNGECLRRYTSVDPLDTVRILMPEDMPDTRLWQRHREAGKPMVIMTDATKVPMVHFVEKMLTNKRITNDDYDFLFNYKSKREAGDVSVNGVSVEEGNIRCSNGFIHKMEEVVTQLPNMAELMAQKKDVSLFNHLLERFCAPYPDRHPEAEGSTTMKYNQMYDAAVDTVYQKRFLSKKSQGEEGKEGLLVEFPDGGKLAEDEVLEFDPGWNAYYAGQWENGSGNKTLQRDMAFIMAPSNEAMEEYWNNGAGKVLKDRYGSWDNVPDNVIVALLNNNMKTSIISYGVPSKFKDILNDANDPMGVSKEHIDSVWLACNGAVYMTNHVYSPTRYISVLCPALINDNMRIINWAVNKMQYDFYLNSLNSYYSFFIPLNKGMLQYIDPVTYGRGQTQLWKFYYDTKQTKVWASRWKYDLTTHMVGDSIDECRDDYMIENRLRDILETHIVVGNVEDGKTYYRTKNGTEIKVSKPSLGADGMTVSGSFQVNEGNPIPVTRVYDQTNGGNGKVYVLEGEPIMGTRMSVKDQLERYPEFSLFEDLLDGSGLYEEIHSTRFACARTNISCFNTYHYTIYAPSNDGIQELYDKGLLPSWDDVENDKIAGDYAKATADSTKILDFLKYHIQDNALFVDGKNKTDQEIKEEGDGETRYETAAMNVKSRRFYRIGVTEKEGTLYLQDEAGNAPRKVLTSGPYNLMAREYQYNSTDRTSANNLETTSSAVIHLIDKPLMIATKY